jgi:outer membrane murein-binding lipoprotein Lpp
MRINNKILLGSLFGSFLFLAGCGHMEAIDSIKTSASEVGTELSNTGSAITDSASSTSSSISDYFGSLFGGSE